MNGRNEGCFLRTLNCGCVVIVAFVGLVVALAILAALV